MPRHKPGQAGSFLLKNHSGAAFFATSINGASVRIMIPQDNRQEAVEVLDFLRTLEDGEEKEMLAFLRGVQFGKRMGAGTAVAG